MSSYGGYHGNFRAIPKSLLIYKIIVSTNLKLNKENGTLKERM
jgi:hypothetical protein